MVWFTYISKRQSDFANSWGFYFHEMRSFAKIKPLRKILILKYMPWENIKIEQKHIRRQVTML